MLRIIISVIFMCVSVPALASGRCADTLERKHSQWKSGSPALQDKSKNPRGVFEVYSIDWKLKTKNKSSDYTGFYFYNDSCHRMKSAEIAAGKVAERRSAEKKAKK